MRVGARAQLNGLFKYSTATGSRYQSWDNIYIPSLILKTRSKVTFFNRPEDKRVVHKVEVTDRNGYHKSFTSDDDETPVGYGVYSKQEVPKNSYDSRVSEAVRPNRPGVVFNIEDQRYFSDVFRSGIPKP